MANSERTGKLYYSIGEVSKIAGVPQSVLRFWETEFSGLRPPRNRSGKRLYRQVEIDRVLRIKKLLYDDRFTIEGARKVLKAGGAEKHNADSPTAVKQNQAAINADEIRRGLKEILDLLGD